ncbi:hypothetical protein A3844_18150 [Paenibacillus helianthi]|uniref:Uncharacterized protein n=1 Tax=Paenibacillus helianthi TaxID=1349432 RepID=A0ABX3EPA1_9BACL|nr:hypothetical protein A3844_18150 [Paenibacillus helianthi]
MGRSMQEKIKDYTELAQYHMKLAHIMKNHKQYKTAFFLCHSALISMIRALCIYEHRTEFGTEISLIDLTLLAHTDYNPGLEIVVFLGELNYIGRYIFSSVPILNADEDGLLLLNTFDNPESAWKIYLYQAK